MKHKKLLIIISIIIAMAAFSYTAIASLFTQPASSKGLVGHWSLADTEGGTGSTTMDMTPYSNNGTRLGETVLASMYTTDRNSQSNKAMTFNGTDDYVNIDGIVADVASHTAGTWSAWVKPDSAVPTNTDRFISLSDTSANEYASFDYMANTGLLRGALRTAAATQWIVDTDVNPFSDGVWTHIALVQDGTEPVIYVNGAKPAQAFTTSTDKTVWMSGLSNIDNGRIGNISVNGAGEDFHFDGDINDVRIYNYALSAEQIEDLYKSNNPVLKGSSLNKGLIGQWSLSDTEGGTGSTTYDMTPYANNGTRLGETVLASIYTTDRNSQSNKAMTFNGTDDYVDLGNDTSLRTTGDLSNFTWIKTISSTGIIVSKFDTGANERSWIHRILSDVYTVKITDDGQTEGAGNSKVYGSSITINDNQWHHVGFTFDASESTLSIYVDGVNDASPTLTQDAAITSIFDSPNTELLVGARQNSAAKTVFFDGSISDVRIYDRALTAEEIGDLYGKYKPVMGTSSLTKGLIGYWGLSDKEGGTGSTTYDMTPYSNNGTRLGETVLASMYTTDRHSQSNNAQTFDGTSDYVDLGSDSGLNTNELTVSAWIKPSLDSPDSIFGKADTAVANQYFLFGAGSHTGSLENEILCILKDSTGIRGCYTSTDRTEIFDNNWHHVAVTADGSAYAIYLDGESKTITLGQGSNDGDTLVTSFDKASIGALETTSVGQYFNGDISDVRLYNRALTAAEIKMLYESY